MRVTCKHCGGPHPAFECRKRSAQAVSSTIDEVEKVAVRSQPSLGRDISTAARKDVPLSSEDSPFARGRRSADGAKAAVDIGSNPRPTAGTQALPVDTNSVRAENEKVRPLISQAVGTTSLAGVEGNEDRQPKFDKKAWMKPYMKTYMARYREDVKSGKRTPKKKVKAS